MGSLGLVLGQNPKFDVKRCKVSASCGRRVHSYLKNKKGFYPYFI